MSSSPKPIGPVLRAWYRWKMLRLPWRKRFLVGFDLEHNTYWEFALARGDVPPANPSSPANRNRPTSTPYRRIVHYPRSTHYSEVRVPPAWHQWLRYRRADPPTLAEQAADVARVARTRALALAADARWEAKERLVGGPTARDQREGAVAAATAGGGGGGEAAGSKSGSSAGAGGHVHRKPEPPLSSTSPGAAASPPPPAAAADKQPENPWKRSVAQGPGETWQPEAWTPSAARKR